MAEPDSRSRSQRLDDHIKEETSNGNMQKAKDQFDSERASSSYPPSELEQATVSLRESVDKICEAMIMVFGKVSDITEISHGQTVTLKSVMRWLLAITIVQSIVCALMLFISITVYRNSDSVEDTRASQQAVVRQMESLTDKFSKVRESTEVTKEIVNEVKKQADESPKLEIVADTEKPGEAVVRIIPPAVDASKDVLKENLPEVEIPLKKEHIRLKKSN